MQKVAKADQARFAGEHLTAAFGWFERGQGAGHRPAKLIPDRILPVAKPLEGCL
jgi:hypothetical protein